MKTYNRKEQYGYLIGMFGQNMLYGVIFTGLAYYYQSVIFLPAAAISVIFAVGKIFDGIKDPIMGNIIDKTKTKWGKCRPFLIFCPPIFAILIIIAFLNGSYSSENTSFTNFLIISWAGVSYLLLGLAYSATDLPLWTLPSLMSENEKDRNKIMSLSRIYSTLGGTLVTLLLIPLSQYLGKTTSDTIDANLSLKYWFIGIAAFLTIIGAGLFLFSGLFTKERVKGSKEGKYTLKENLKIMKNCRPFRRLTLSCGIRGMNATSSLSFMTLFSYYYGNNGMTNYLPYFIVINGSSVLGQVVITFLMPKIIEKGNRKKLYFFWTVVYGISYLLIFVLYLLFPDKLDEPLYVFLFSLLMFTGGLGVGGILVLHSVMTADSVDFYEYETGYRPDGVFFSGMTMVYKFATGFSAIILGIVYGIVGWSGDNVKTVNEALYNGAIFKSDVAFSDYRMAIFILFALMPAIFIFLSVIPMIKYKLSGEERRKMEKALEEKRKCQ